MVRRKRRCVGPTDDWEQLELLCVWPEQRKYERPDPLVLFGEPVPERSVETGTPERTLYRRIAAFRGGGMGSLFESPKVKRREVTKPRTFRHQVLDTAAPALRAGRARRGRSAQRPRTRCVRRPVPKRARVNSGGTLFLPRSPVARIARVRSPRLNRVTLCRTERHKYQLGRRTVWYEPIIPDSTQSQLPTLNAYCASNSTGGRYSRLECSRFSL